MFDEKILEDARKDALARYPQESCGAVTESGYVSFKNVYPEPEKGFECHDEATALSLTTPLLAMIHSHPISSINLMNGEFGPSRADMQAQMITNIPWGIIATDGTGSKEFFWGDSLPIPPLEGRQFRHGPSGTDGRGDCYALIRDWYRLNKNITMEDMPRDDLWWGENIGQNLYLENFEKWGFVLSDRTNPKIGDVALAPVMSANGVPNHGGIYVGNGLILHHLPKRYSRIEPIANWMKFITHWVRKNDCPD